MDTQGKKVSLWEKLNASSEYSWIRTISLGLGVLGIGLLIALIGLLVFWKK